MNNFAQPRGQPGPGPGLPGAQQAAPFMDQLKVAIFNQLRKQGTLQGWQSQISHNVRAGYVLQIFTAHRLTRNAQIGTNNDPAELKAIVGGAVEFEKNAFHHAPNFDAYKAVIDQKLRQLTALRQQMSVGMQLGPSHQPQQMSSQQQPAMPSQQTFTGPPGHHNIPGQFVGNMQLGPGSQSQPQPPARNVNGIQRPESRPAMGQGQSQAPGRPGMAVNNPGASMNQMDQNLLNQYTGAYLRQLQNRGQLEAFRKAALNNLAPELAQQLRNNNADLVQYRCREEAFKTLQQRAAARGMTFPSQPGQPSLSQSLQSSMGTQMPGAMTGNTALGVDFSQLQGQQADAKRSQEAGDLVVPASNNQGHASQLGQKAFPAPPANKVATAGNLGAGQQRQNQNRQAGPRPAPQLGMAQQPPNQGQGNTAVQSTPKRQPNSSMLTGQVGGLHASQQGQAPSPMQWLNRPIAIPDDQARTPGSLHPPQPQRSQQPSPQPGAARNQRQQPPPQPVRNNQTTGPNNRPGPHGLQPPPSMPDHVRNQLAALPRDQAQMMIRNFESNQMANMSRFQAQQNAQLSKHIANQPSAQQHQANMNGQNVQRDPLAAQQIPTGRQPAGTPSVPQGVPQVFPNSAMNQPIQPNDLEIPRTVLKQVAPNLDIPQGILNWGQFKHWLALNPMIASQINQSALQNVHVAQYNNYKQQSGFANRPNNVGTTQQLQSNAASQGAQPPPQGIPIPERLLPQANMLAQRGVILASNGLARVHVSPVEVQNCRHHQMSRGQTMNQSDEQLRQAIMTMKLRKIAEVDEQWAQILYRHAQAVIASSNNAVNPQAQRVQGAEPQRQGQQLNHQQPQRPQVQPGVNPSLQPGMQMRRPPQPSTPGALVQQNPPISQVSTPMRAPARPESQTIPSKLSNQPMMAMSSASGPQMDAKLNPTQTQINDAQEEENAAKYWASVPLKEKQDRLKAIMGEITQAQANQKSHPGTMQPPDVARWSRQLEALHAKIPLLMEKVHQLYYERGHESLTREVIACIMRVRQQCHVDPKTQRVTVQITRNPRELQEMFVKLSAFHSNYIVKRPQGQNLSQSSGAGTAVAQQPSQAPPTDPAQIQAAVTHTIPKKPSQDSGPSLIPKRGSVKAPSAAEGSPPSSFVMGTPTPDGRPVYAQGQNFNLHLPDKKRRKPPQNTDTAISSASATASQKKAHADQVASNETVKIISTAASTVAQAPPAELHRPFKCSIPGCISQVTGFVEKQQQIEHQENVHGYLGDALDFCLKSMHEALGLGKEAESNQRTSSMTAGADKASEAAHGDSKNQVKMSSSNSNAPQEKDGIEDPLGIMTARVPSSQPNDPWERSSIRPEEIHSLFGEIEGVTQMNLFGTGPIEWLSPPTPPPSHPSLSASPFDTTKDPGLAGPEESAGDSSMVDEPMTPEQDDWDELELTKDSGLKRSAFDEMWDRENTRSKKRRSVERE